jgi:hypothetical protein
LSSTTDVRRESREGQVLVIFALCLTTLMIVAALAFDTGMVLLELRDQRNAADAAALAGARFLPGDTTAARAAAFEYATRNGFTNGVESESVEVFIPPVSGPFAGDVGFIEVRVAATRSSILAQFAGILDWDIGARAVAANITGNRGTAALIALDESGCNALIVEGEGELRSFGDIQVNSTCEPNAMRVAGEGEIITAPGVGCDVVGDPGFQAGGGADYDCTVDEGVAAIPDPYLGVPEPPIPMTGDPPEIEYPTPPAQEGGAAAPIPAGCPGSATAATDAVPAACRFNGSYAGTTWRLYPGYYPGGINLEAGIFYLEPGIYYVAGGFDPGGGVGPVSFRIAGGGASVTSVAAGMPTLGGGILIFNGEHATLQDGKIVLQGGDAGVNLWPLNDGSDWQSMVVFQDRDVCVDMSIVGGSSTMQVRGVIYIPCGTVVAEGDGGAVITDQIIAFRFQMKGNIGSLSVLYDDDFLPPATYAGLVE